MSVTRETLYEEVWAEPMTKVAARYGMASNLLGRICDRLKVPCPSRGYWAQVKVGKAEPRPPLPLARQGDEVVWFHGYGERRYAVPHTDRPAPDYLARAKKHPDSLHPLVADTQADFENGRVTREGYLRPAKRTLPDIFVPKTSLERALSVLSDFFWQLERAGHTVVFAPRDEIYLRPFVNHHGGKDELQSYERWMPERPTLVFVAGVAFGLTLFELAETVEGAYVNNEWVPLTAVPKRGRWANPYYTSSRSMPSGKFCLRVYSPYSGVSWEKRWQENAAGDLKKVLSAVVKELEAASPSIVIEVAEAAHRREEEVRRWEAERKEWEIRETARKKAEAEKESRQDLLAIVQKWSLACQIEAFFKDLERRTAESDEASRTELSSRLSRARALLGGIDALAHFEEWASPEELLSDD
ncbi:MAG TPA: hypothetical protein VGM13_04575 [Thermoanaerobaculia bacterium]|jgi:hypothetical protein